MCTEDHRSIVETAGEKAYRRIREDIVSGVLQPSQRLRLDGLKETYGVSISTLRELLNRLTSEGLIVAEGARGFEVAPISVQNFKEVANLRQLLEIHALEELFAAGDMDWEGRVVAAHHKLSLVESRMLAGNRAGADAWKRYDFEFHHALLSAAVRRCCSRPIRRSTTNICVTCSSRSSFAGRSPRVSIARCLNAPSSATSGPPKMCSSFTSRSASPSHWQRPDGPEQCGPDDEGQKLSVLALGWASGVPLRS